MSKYTRINLLFKFSELCDAISDLSEAHEEIEIRVSPGLFRWICATIVQVGPVGWTQQEQTIVLSSGKYIVRIVSC